MQAKSKNMNAFSKSHEIKGVLSGSFAILLWSLLPLLRQATKLIPPMQLVTMSLAAAALISTACWIPKKIHPLNYVHLPLQVWFGAVGGLIGALFLYFWALVQAPPAEVTLITYIWPLVFALVAEIQSNRLPSAKTLFGASLAFVGAGLLIMDDLNTQIKLDYLAGYLAGVGSGICWVFYSLVMRKHKEVSGPSFPWIFGLASILALILHMLTENTCLNLEYPVLCAAIGIGIGPYGLAFIAWSFGVRVGPPGLISSLAYATPVVSTLLLIMVGNTQAKWQLAIAALGIICGASIAGGNYGRKKRSH